jgi:hypothetical protein
MLESLTETTKTVCQEIQHLPNTKQSVVDQISGADAKETLGSYN